MSKRYYQYGPGLIAREDRGYRTKCYIWQHRLDGKGYAYVYLPDLQITIHGHKFVWVEANGPVPDRYRLHHKCEQKSCIRLEHLELVTPQMHYAKHRMANVNGRRRAAMESKQARQALKARQAAEQLESPEN